MDIDFPPYVRSDIPGYNFLAQLYSETRTVKKEEVVFNFSQTKFFDGNLSTVLAAIITKLKENFNNVKLINFSRKVEEILLKNGFLAFYDGRKIVDTFLSTIQFRKFQIGEDFQFREYLDQELLSKNGMPVMSDNLKKKINRSILEIFSNADIHGRTSNIYSCGQYFPRQNKILDFTIVDLGRTIRKNVRDFMKSPDYGGIEAIKWAVQEGHTTKTGAIPGGLGFSLIREFLHLNGGKLQIASSDGFYEESGTDLITRQLDFEFIGTIVNIEFNLSDSNTYSLTEEIDIKELF